MRNLGLISALVAGAALAASPSQPAPPSGEGKAKRPRRFVRANVGRNHPDYGLSVEAHAANKLARTGRPY